MNRHFMHLKAVHREGFCRREALVTLGAFKVLVFLVKYQIIFILHVHILSKDMNSCGIKLSRR